MSAHKLTDDELRKLLLAVGLDPASGAEAYTLRFDELDLDSLARFELASRIGDRFGINIEDEVTAECTPDDVRKLVNERVSATV